MLDEITDADLKDQNFLQEIINRIGKEPEVIADYLRYHALPQVLHFPEKMTSTGADLSQRLLCHRAIFSDLEKKSFTPT